MIRTIRSLIAGLLITTALCFAAAPVSAQVLDPVCATEPNATICQENQEERPDNNRLYGPNGILTRVVNILSIIVGIASVIVILIGGLKYIASSGDPNGINQAKNTILYALVGIIVAVLSRAIIAFVLNRL